MNKELTATDVIRLQKEYNRRHQEKMDAALEPILNKMLELARKYDKKTPPT